MKVSKDGIKSGNNTAISKQKDNGKSDSKWEDEDETPKINSASMQREPRKRVGLMGQTQVSKERNFARLKEIKEISHPPMKYSNQGHNDIVPNHTR